MTVRIGFIGTGGIAVSHLENLVSMPDTEVVALCDLAVGQVERARMAVEGTTGRRLDAAAYTDYGMMLGSSALLVKPVGEQGWQARNGCSAALLAPDPALFGATFPT